MKGAAADDGADENAEAQEGVAQVPHSADRGRDQTRDSEGRRPARGTKCVPSRVNRAPITTLKQSAVRSVRE